MNPTRRSGFLFVSVPAFVVLVFALTACDDKNVAVPDQDNPCVGVDCSGHGQCAVVVGDTAVCICDTGYHSEGLSCVENVVGQECSGVTCSGHGTCVVVRGDPDYPFCVCDQGYRNAGDTNCVEWSGGLTCGPGTHEENGQCVPGQGPVDNPCVSNAECDPGEVCSLETGDCEAVPPEECGLPPAEGGTTPFHGSCGEADYRCGDGFTCVKRWEVMDISTGEYHLYSGYCQVACDPCAPDCPEGLDCIKLAGPGGFCGPGPLHLEGEPCFAGSAWPWWRFVCAAGLSCYGGGSDPTCTRTCVPDNQALWTTEYLGHGAASTSADCMAGQICSGGVVFNAPTREVAFTCKAGMFASTGSTCSPAEGLWCAYPDFCHLSFGAASGVCSSDCNNNPCPAGIDCFDLGIALDGNPVGTCVVDGSLRYNAVCAEERNCESWLDCLPDGQGQTRCIFSQ